MNNDKSRCECFLCKNNNPIDIPEEIVQAAYTGELVLFCGAGISTENRNVVPFTFYEQVMDELEKKECDKSFSALMTEYCSKPNGRVNMIKLLKKRFEYIDSFPEMRRQATKFHEELSKIPYITTIITTNWDTYFERICGAVPFIDSKGIALWDSAYRKVLKIHGSVDNVGSLIATERDYSECFKVLTNSVLGSKLIEILATKTVVFIGFSFGDEDLSQILALIKEQMASFMPHIYIVSLDEDITQKLGDYSVTSFNTDGTFFLHELRKRFMEDEMLRTDEDGAFDLLFLEHLNEIHRETSNIPIKENPLILYSLMYQDGLIHAFERMSEERLGLYYSWDYIDSCIKMYEEIVHEKSKGQELLDCIYAKGYLTGLKHMGRKERPNFFFLPEKDIDCYDVDEFMTLLKNEDVEQCYKDISEACVNKVGENLVIHHPPWL